MAIFQQQQVDPDSMLARFQIISLPINAVVAGTPLRGMFEERIQHVIRELKEPPNLILFRRGALACRST